MNIVASIVSGHVIQSETCTEINAWEKAPQELSKCLADKGGVVA